jgi:hypothetical protein
MDDDFGLRFGGSSLLVGHYLYRAWTFLKLEDLIRQSNELRTTVDR